MNPLETNIEEAFRAFESYTAEELTYAIRRAVNKAAWQLKDTTLQNFRATGVRQDPNPRYNDTLEDGVRMKKSNVTNMGEDIFSVVSILGSRASGSGTFRLRFFEKGTQDRYQTSSGGQAFKKPRYVGRLKPRLFFKDANTVISNQLQSIYEDEINKAIDKINMERGL